ncbi:MAG: bifunctional 4-hydroxy-2-oxoglutarate aldolase/2-dehydro-3-deoxy-phosphogluconate aldolase [Treponemataceae bacterium]
MLEKYVQIKIIPVAVVTCEEEIRHIADFCMEYLPSLELTMRTDYAYKALEILAKDYPALPFAAATILNTDQADRAYNAGAKIIISPGFQPAMLEHCKAKKYDYIPGVATAAEIEQCLAYGHTYLKMFPASVIGGIDWLKAVAPVYSHTGVKFMPLGGIKPENVENYLSQSNVFACGGSWLCPQDLLAAKKWDEIKKRFQEAARLIKTL